MPGLGFDCGTYNLVTCRRDGQGNFEHKREVNAFLEIPLDNRFVFNMMKAAGVPLIEREKVAYALGEAAVDMAYTMSATELRRPMCEGCVNPREKDAFEIMSIMMRSLVGEVSQDKELLYYTVPANAINSETDADYHRKILQAIFNSYRSDAGLTVSAFPINEGLALIYAELGHKAFTGASVSFGGGMVNFCFAIFGAPVFQFAIVQSGDHIDRMAARATGESVSFINREKTKIDLSKSPSTLVERAIQTQYHLMVERCVTNIKKGLADAGNKARSDKPIDIVISGGTSSPSGFPALFAEVIAQAGLPLKVGEIIHPSDPLYSVSRGALIAAENHSS